MASRFFGFSIPAKMAAGIALATIASSVVITGNSETLLRSSFETALKKNSVRPAVQASRAPISGSEEFWLTAMPQNGGTPVSKTVSIGDRIAMTLGGVEKQLEVAAVSEFQPKATEIDTNARSVHLVLVTARDTGDEHARPIRFVMELDTTSEPLTGANGAAQQAKTL